jgi:hypothetical protein
MSGQPPNQPRQDELPDIMFRGPFGGFQSELPLDDIEDVNGFQDTLNMMFRIGRASPRPPANAQALLPNPQEPFVGETDFFTALGNRIQTVITPTRMFQWNPLIGTWTQITGALSGPANQLFTWSVVGGKLYFCQGVNIVQMWDGITPGFANAAATAVPGKYLFELDNHLLVCNTIEAGPAPAPQRVHWTGIGDGTDWTSLESGQVDLFNDLGPITGGVKLFQSGYIFQQWGIIQVTPTGIGTSPFYFSSLSAHSKGCIAPYSLAAFGEDIVAYVGKDNIYIFDGTSSTPIGDAPYQGRRRIGARSAIFVDLSVSNLNTVFGYLSSSINGNPYKAYWLFTNVSTWVYNFDEGNWTRFAFQKTPTMAGTINRTSGIEIMQLIGTIAQQSWSPDTLTGNTQLDSMFLGFSDGTPGIIDFTGTCESTALLQSGQCYFGDRMHSKTLKRFIIKFRDLGPVSFIMTVVNEKGFSQTQTVLNLGTGSGQVLKKQIPGFNISGHDLVWTLTIKQNQAVQIVEIRPKFDVGGEFREPN